MAVNDIPVGSDANEGLITHCQLQRNASIETANSHNVIVADRPLPTLGAAGKKLA